MVKTDRFNARLADDDWLSIGPGDLEQDLAVLDSLRRSLPAEREFRRPTQ